MKIWNIILTPAITVNSKKQEAKPNKEEKLTGPSKYAKQNNAISSVFRVFQNPDCLPK